MEGGSPADSQGNHSGVDDFFVGLGVVGACLFFLAVGVVVWLQESPRYVFLGVWGDPGIGYVLLPQHVFGYPSRDTPGWYVSYPLHIQTFVTDRRSAQRSQRVRVSLSPLIDQCGDHRLGAHLFLAAVICRANPQG